MESHLTQLFIDNEASILLSSVGIKLLTSHSMCYAKTQKCMYHLQELREMIVLMFIRISVYDPATTELVSDSIPVAGEQDVDLAVEAAQRAFRPSSPWRQMTAYQRQKLLLKFADILEANTDYLAKLTRQTLGAPFSAFGKGEIDTAITCFRCTF